MDSKLLIANVSNNNVPLIFATRYGRLFGYEGEHYGLTYDQSLDVLLAGPNADDYWDVWFTILEYARHHKYSDMLLYINEEGELFLLTPADFEEAESGLTTHGTYGPQGVQ
jgi:hypothetical protein